MSSNEIQQFSRSNLRPTKTKITYIDGRIFMTAIHDTNKPEELVTNQLVGYVVQTEPDLTVDQIISNLYLSGDDVAQDFDLLTSKSITHILNLTTNVQNLYESKKIQYKRMQIYDMPTENILQHFSNAFEFLTNALSDCSNSVLVHCNAGVSRSASFVIGYLMQRGLFKNYADAYKHVKSCRSKICPNDGFVLQLKQYEQSLQALDKTENTSDYITSTMP